MKEWVKKKNIYVAHEYKVAPHHILHVHRTISQPKGGMNESRDMSEWVMSRAYYKKKTPGARTQDGTTQYPAGTPHHFVAHRTLEWVMLHVWMSQGKTVYLAPHGLFFPKKSVFGEHKMAPRNILPVTPQHTWMSHVTRMNESCHTYGWVMSHVWMCRVTRMNKSHHMYEWVNKIKQKCFRVARTQGGATPYPARDSTPFPSLQHI